jgi:type IV secretory pathway VirB4 component
MAKKISSTQNHLDIEDIRDDLVLLKDGNVSMVLETTSLNFELLAEEEQDARILSFASLLNSIKFPMQIVIRTERTDVNDYLDKLAEYREQHSSKALRKQMEIYTKFIRNLTVKTEVLNKRFFVVIPKRFVAVSKGFSFTDTIFGKSTKIDALKNLQKAKDDLYPKRELVIKQFRKIGIKVWQLKNDELIQLFYNIYDPDKVGIKRVQVQEGDYTSGLIETLTDSQDQSEPQPGNKNSSKDNLIDEVVGAPPTKLNSENAQEQK